MKFLNFFPSIAEVNNSIHKVRGVYNFGLSDAQVETKNFGGHTLYFIKILKSLGLAEDYQEAFELVKELNEYQCQGVIYFELFREQVCNPNFGSHTLKAISALVSSDDDTDYQEVYELVKEFNETQCQRVVDFELSLSQVQTLNFGAHTLEAIHTLVSSGRVKDYNEAFEMVKQLDEAKVKGVLEFKLDRKQLLNSEFEAHTYITILALVEKNLVNDYQEAFEMVKDFNRIQTRGIRDFYLFKEQVLTDNFGDHIMNAMFVLKKQGRVKNYQEAFLMLVGLNRVQAAGIVSFFLTRDQVENSAYNENILETMWALNQYVCNDKDKLKIEWSLDLEVLNSKEIGANLYEIAMSMKAYQIRGILEYNLAPSNVGVEEEVFGNKLKFVLKDADYNITQETLYLLDSLSSPYPVFTKSKENPINISKVKVNALVNYGLSFEQVSTKLNDFDTDLLEELDERLENTIDDLYLPLIKDQQVISRAEFDKIVKEKNIQNANDTEEVINSRVISLKKLSEKTIDGNYDTNLEYFIEFEKVQNLKHKNSTRKSSKALPKNLQHNTEKPRNKSLLQIC